MGQTGQTIRSVKVVLSGYYGFDNSGDEAVLQSILLALKEQGEKHGIHFEPTVLSIDPEKTSRTYGVNAAHRMKPGAVLGAIRGADALISGGGSLLQDATSSKTIPYYLAILKLAQWFGKPTFIYSQGIGPVHRRFFDPWIRGTFAKCRYVSVRDIESANLLQSMGLPKDRVQVVPDPVMGLPLKEGVAVANRESEPVVGISVRFWNEDRSELAALALGLNAVLARSSVKLNFLPFHLPSDDLASQYVVNAIDPKFKQRVSISGGITHPQDMLAEVSRCDLLIGMRLHSLIYAASQCVPLVGISYDPKIDQFLGRIGMKAAATTQSAESESIARHILTMLEQTEAWKREKQPAIERLKAEAQLPARHITQFFKQLDKS